MKIVKISIFLLSFSWLIALLVSNGATKPIDFANKIAFLKGGEVWIADQNGQSKVQVTTTARKVEDFIISPDMKYFAYTKVLKYVDEPGLFEEGEEVPKRSVCSIVVVDLGPRKVLSEILPENNWICLARWLPDQRLLCYESSGFDVSVFFELDIVKGTKNEVAAQKANQLWEADFSPDGSLMLYTDDSGLGATYRMNLHMADLRTKEDRVLLSHKSIYVPRLSNDKKSVAFLEVSNEKGKSLDSLWVYNIEKGALKKYFTGPARPKSAGERSVSWSPGNRYVSLFLAPEALVFALENPDDVHKITGREFSWAGERSIVCASGADLYTYDLDAGAKQLLVKEASNPRFLLRQ
jgi:Tol biopolymer transport system component